MSSNGTTKKTDTTPSVKKNAASESAPKPVQVTKTATATPEENHFQTKIYDAFLKLSQFNPNVRFEGIRLIISYFNSNAATLGMVKQQQNEKNHNEYILSRLVKGLASNRKCSRMGFSCTLTELFTKFEDLKFQTVLDIANKHLKFKIGDEEKATTKNILTKEEMRHMQIGLAFVYVAFIQSTRLDNILETDKSQLQLLTSLVNN